jgi:pimeloyl-ACP methyl ester carboxylesterase
MHERIPGSQLEILPGLRHSILIEAPDLVAALMRPFLAGEDGEMREEEMRQ